MPVVSRLNWTKLLAAGCIIGVLSGVSVGADAGTEVDTFGGDDGAVDDAYGGGDDGAEDDSFGGEVDAADEDAEVDAEDEDAEVDAADEDAEVDAEDEDAEVDAEDEDAEVDAADEDAEVDAADEDAEDDISVTGDLAAAPDAAAATSVGVYTAYTGKDYIPADAIGAGAAANMVLVMDIDGAGALVADQTECEELCDATAECNLASFYVSEAEDLPGGLNCYPKTIEEACELPVDASDDPAAILLLKCEETLAVAPVAVAPAPEAVETGAAVDDVDSAVDDVDDVDSAVDDVAATDRDVGTGEVDDTTSFAVSVCSSVAALAVAGAAATLI